MRRFLIILALLVFDQSYADTESIRRAGDFFQIANPLIVATVMYEEEKLSHYLQTYGATMAVMALSKYVGNQAELRPWKRPDSYRYDGMPSGHTTSAWLPAAYMSRYSEHNRHLIVPMYCSAAFTGYSRVRAERHTVSQVICAIILSETSAIVSEYINRRI